MRISDWSSDVCSSDLVSFKCVAICYIAGSQLSWQRVGLTQALGRRSILESPCFSHLKQSCLGVVHCFLLAHFYLQAARTLTGVLLSERRLSAACCPPSSFLVSLRLLGTSMNAWLATNSQVYALLFLVREKLLGSMATG